MRSFELSQTLEDKQCLQDICGLLGNLLWWDPVEDPTGSRLLGRGFRNVTEPLWVTRLHLWCLKVKGK